MPRFRCFFIDESDRVRGFESCECASTTEAVDHAQEMLRARPGTRAVELWDSGLFVARIPGSTGKEGS